MFKEIKKMIEKYNTIIIERHARPDGDALGSQIGLREALLETYPDKKKGFDLGADDYMTKPIDMQESDGERVLPDISS